MNLIKIAKLFSRNYKFYLFDNDELTHNMGYYKNAKSTMITSHEELFEFACDNPELKVINMDVENDCIYITYERSSSSNVEFDEIVELLEKSDEITPFVLLVTKKDSQQLVSLTIEEEIDYEIIEEFATNYTVDVEFITRDEYKNLIIVCSTDELGYHKISQHVQKFFQ